MATNKNMEEQIPETQETAEASQDPETPQPGKTKTKAKQDERVELYVPRGGEREDPNLVISINGVNYQLPRGKKSMVPPFVKEEYDRSELARNHMFENKAQIIERQAAGTNA